MTTQDVLAALAVAASAWYVARRTWRTWFGGKGGCGTCAAASAPKGDRLISADELMQRLRNRN
jgi:hypothetical protein